MLVQNDMIDKQTDAPTDRHMPCMILISIVCFNMKMMTVIHDNGYKFRFVIKEKKK